MYDRTNNLHPTMNHYCQRMQDRSGSYGMTLIHWNRRMRLPVRWWWSILASRVRVNSFCNIDSAVLLPEEQNTSKLRRCVIDRQLFRLHGDGENGEEDARRRSKKASATRERYEESINRMIMQVLYGVQRCSRCLKPRSGLMLLGHYPAQIADGADARVLLPAF